jgi:hypothetical protein
MTGKIIRETNFIRILELSITGNVQKIVFLVLRGRLSGNLY